MAISSIAGAIIGNSGAKKASKAQVQAAQIGANEVRAGRELSYNTLNPFVQSGIPATQAINALLGLGPPQYSQAPAQAPAADPQSQGILGQMVARLQGTPAAPPPAPAAGPPQYQYDPNQAFSNYRNSTGYQFRLNEGLNAINGGYAGAGTIKSGAAMKGIADYGQNIASGEFANYLAALGNQQQMGLSAGSAVAGVAQNSANSLADLAKNAGDARANAALVKAQNTSNAVQSGINSLATVFGGGGGIGKTLGKLF